MAPAIRRAAPLIRLGAATVLLAAAACSQPPKAQNVAARSSAARPTDTNGYGAPGAARLRHRFMRQGWSRRDRLRFWFTSQGSRVIPYRWFLHLERADGTVRIGDAGNIRRYRFIPYPAQKRWNPDGLPVGFVKDVDRRTGKEWIGLTCAACHTGIIVAGRTALIVDGAPTMADFQGFFQDLAAAMRRTLDDPAKFDRFAAGVLGGQASAERKAALRRAFSAETRRREAREAMNRTPHRYGFGRVDAFGQIFNAIAATALKVPGNAKPPDAPVSYPVLWGSNQSDVVQWNGIASNHTRFGPLSRNAGQVLGVFGTLDIAPKRLRYRTSTKLRNLQRLEAMIARLEAPRWPAALLGRLDPALVAAGRRIFTGESEALPVDQVCANCHAVRLFKRPGRFFEHAPGSRRIPPRYHANMIPVLRVGTDPGMAANSLRSAQTGILKGRAKLPLSFPVERFGATAETAELLVHVVSGVIINRLTQAGSLRREKGADHRRSRLQRMRYKARPLDGIWASAPYLHNGSVPTLADLLLPPEKRPHVFCLGDLRYDRTRVGFAGQGSADCARRGGFRFDTRRKGNANTGHRYGTGLTGAQKAALIAYLKSL
jgi:cytochrome c peroxidase